MARTNFVRLLAEMDAAPPPPQDPTRKHRETLGEVLAKLDQLAVGHPPRMHKAKRNRMQFGLENARRELRRALDALAPQGSG